MTKRYIAQNPRYEGEWGYEKNGVRISYGEWERDLAQAQTLTPQFFRSSEVPTWESFGANGKVVSLYDTPEKAKRYGKRVLVVDMDLLPQLEYDDAEKEYQDMERLAVEYMQRAEKARGRMQ